MIIGMTPWSVQVRVKGRTATLDGEAFAPGYGSPDFVAYRKSLVAWDDGAPMTDEEREDVLADLLASASDEGERIEVV